MIKEWELSEENINIKELENVYKYNNLSDLRSSSFLLDVKNEQFSYLERFIYDIAMFHFEKTNIIFNEDVHYIQFNFNNHNNNNKLHNQFIPLLNIVTYFNDSTFVNLISNIDKEKYKYKDLEHLEFCVSFPKKLKQISFMGKNYYDEISLSSMVSNDSSELPGLYIHLLDKRPSNVYYYYEKYTNSVDKKFVNINEIKNNKIIDIKNDIHNFDFFDDLIYRKEKECYITIFKSINKEDVYKYNTFSFKRDNFNIIEKISVNNRINIDADKFSQIYVDTRYFQSEVCSWIISESELYASRSNGWINDSKNNISMLPVEKMMNVFSFIIHSSENIIQKIKSYYSIDINSIVQINDINIIKDSWVNPMSSTDNNIKSNDMYIQIMLYEGFDKIMEMSFKNGPKIVSKRGDMIIYSKTRKDFNLRNLQVGGPGGGAKDHTEGLVIEGFAPPSALQNLDSTPRISKGNPTTNEKNHHTDQKVTQISSQYMLLMSISLFESQ